jgi:hypothetical protein
MTPLGRILRCPEKMSVTKYWAVKTEGVQNLFMHGKKVEQRRLNTVDFSILFGVIHQSL